MKELVNKRTEYGKSYDIGNGQEQVNIFINPIHYFSPKGSGSNQDMDSWEDTNAKLDLFISKKDYGSHYISDKHKYSYGFRNDKKNNKFYGIRKGDNNQIEGTLKSVNINGDYIKIPENFKSINKLNDTSVEHVIDEKNSVYNQIDINGFKSALKTSLWVEDFEIVERLDIKGFTITNEFIDRDGYREYLIDDFGCFNFSYEDGTLTISPAMMWNIAKQCDNGIIHRLIEKNGEILYIKTPNREGKNWLLLNRPPFYIDVTLYKSSTSYLTSTDTSSWANARAGTGVTNTADSCTVGVSYADKLGYFVYHGFQYFNLSSYSGTVTGTSYLYLLVASTGGYAHYINAYKASSNTSWDTSTSNYVGQVYSNNSSSTWLNCTIASNLIPLGGTTYYRLRDYGFDVSNSAPSNNYTSTVSNAYLSFSYVLSSNAIFFGFNF